MAYQAIIKDRKPKKRVETIEGKKRCRAGEGKDGTKSQKFYPSTSKYEIDINSIQHNITGMSKYCQNGSGKSWIDPKLATEIGLNAKATVSAKWRCMCYFSAEVRFTEHLKLSLIHI